MSKKLREAARQALEALRLIYIAPEHEEYIRVWWPACREAITALRAALSESDTRRWNIERDGEALLICDGQHENHESCEYRRYVLAKPETVQEPVAWASKRDLARIKEWDAVAYASGGFDDAVPLYLAPPQRPPLTDDEILALVKWHRYEMYLRLTSNSELIAEAKAETLQTARRIERKVRGDKE